MLGALARGSSLAIEDSVRVQRDLRYRREVQIARITEISGSKSAEYGRTIVKEIGRKIEISNAAYVIGAVNEIVAELLKRNSGIQFS